MSGGRAALFAVLALGGGLWLCDVTQVGARGDATGAPLFTAWGQPSGQGGVGVGAAPRGLEDSRAETCIDCHVEVGEEWQRSLHRHSYRDELFQAGYRADPLPMCRDCHAPLARAGQALTELAAAEGVSCSVCHVRDGRVLATRVTAAGRRAHPMRRAPELGDSSFCASCHQFRFPAADMVKRLIFDPSELMQKTFAEWRASAAAARGQTCQDCHMPLVPDDAARDGQRQRRSHRFPGLGDLDFVRRAVDVRVEARDRGDAIFVRGTIEAHGVGHSLPTGDMFRQLVLRVWPEKKPELERRVVMSREFGARAVITPGPAGAPSTDSVADVTLLRAETRDRRIAAGEERRFAFALASPGAQRVRYRLEIWRMSEAQARRQRVDIARTRVAIYAGVVDVVR